MPFSPANKRSISQGSNLSTNSSSLAATSASINDKRQLVRPSAHIPWSVDVVSAVPRALGTSASLLVDAAASASCPGWACVASHDGYVHVWQPKTTSLVQERVQGPRDFRKIYLPHLNLNTGPDPTSASEPAPAPAPARVRPSNQGSDSPAATNATDQRIFLGLRASIGDRGDAVNLFALHAATGILTLRKITKADLHSRLPLPGKTTTVRIDLEEGESATTLSISPNGGIVVIGTSWGRLYWITHTLVPAGLHVRLMQDSSASSGILSRIASGLVSTVSYGTGVGSGSGKTPSIGHPIQQIIIKSTPSSTKGGVYTMYSVTSPGDVTRWMITPTVADAHHASFAACQIGNLLVNHNNRQLTAQQPWLFAGGLSNNGNVSINVIRVTLSDAPSSSSLASSSGIEMSDDTMMGGNKEHDSIHAIVRANRGNESKLFWLEGTIISDTTATTDNSNSSSGNAKSRSPPSFRLVRAQWLSRFAVPSHVQVLALLSAANGIVYGSFCSLASNSINHNTNIIMAVSSNNNINNTSNRDNSNRDSDSDVVHSADGNQQEGDIIHEVDLPTTQVPALLPDAFAKDTVTHGFTAITTSGLGIRVRLIRSRSSKFGPPIKRLRSGDSATPASMALIQTLMSHLRSVFWQSYQNTDESIINGRLLPPSLTQADAEDLEVAVIAFAKELQHKVDKSSAQNPLEWHATLIQLLQNGGLYRSLSTTCRYQLLSIGQQLAVFDTLSNHRAEGSWEQDQLSKLQSYDIADWLLKILTQEEQTNWPHAPTWASWLHHCLHMASFYRDERAVTFYDVPDDQPFEFGSSTAAGEFRPFLSHPSFQSVLLRQIEHLRREASLGVGLDVDQAETVVAATLRSFGESCEDSDRDSKKQYAKVKVLCIGLLRMINGGDDETAFDLSVQYGHFEAICQISADHEKKRDASSYALDRLLDETEQVDLLSGSTFAQFVLQWHVDKGMFGHVLNYGRHSPKDLNALLRQDERLRPYRWVQHIRQGDYDGATDSLLHRCAGVDDVDDANRADDITGDRQEGAKGMAATTKNILWSLSMAKLSQRLNVTKSRSVLDRGDDIERRLDLVNCQQMLTEGESSNAMDSETEARVTTGSEALMAPHQLVKVALDKLGKTSHTEERVRLCFIALMVCSCVEDESWSQRMAAELWSYCLWCDTQLWLDWIRTQKDLTDSNLRELATESTVFGQVLEELRGVLKDLASANTNGNGSGSASGLANDGGQGRGRGRKGDRTENGGRPGSRASCLKAVCYGKQMEGMVLEKWGHPNSRSEMIRLLHSVSYNPQDEIRAKMLISGTF